MTTPNADKEVEELDQLFPDPLGTRYYVLSAVCMLHSHFHNNPSIIFVHIQLVCIRESGPCSQLQVGLFDGPLSEKCCEKCKMSQVNSPLLVESHLVPYMLRGVRQGLRK